LNLIKQKLLEDKVENFRKALLDITINCNYGAEILVNWLLKWHSYSVNVGIAIKFLGL